MLSVVRSVSAITGISRLPNGGSLHISVVPAKNAIGEPGTETQFHHHDHNQGEFR
jgi:hypothetical protein